MSKFEKEEFMKTKRYLWWWSFWIGLVSGVFCYLYSMFPIARENLLFASFVSLPIFFGTSGAELKEYPSYILCTIVGIIWGVAMLSCMGVLTTLGMSGSLQMLLVVGLLTFLAVAIHMIILGNTMLNKVPMIFGGIAMTFFCSMYKNIELLTLFNVAITMAGGLTMGIFISIGGKRMKKMNYFKDDPSEVNDSTKIKENSHSKISS
jgi:MFS family permease